ncbi:MAG TPA: HAD family hydrolase [Candidatus Polarisedimenticolaceae bacterium]|nr:HAD family hydrolase [Candidatus Polarisedimenticolaceae bacterium]
MAGSAAELMAPELVVFDCDGVLVDSEPVANRILAEALRALGLPASYADVCRDFLGLSLPQCLAIIERRLGRPAPADFLERLQQRTYAAFRRELQPVPGVVEALERIELPVCVASSGEPEKIRLALGLTGLLPRFEGRIFSALEVARGKPAPDLFLHAARSLGAQPAACVVVEDSVPGVLGARRAGMAALGYAGSADPASLVAAGARVFHEMRELPELLRASPDE